MPSRPRRKADKSRPERQRDGRGGVTYTRYLELKRKGNTWEEIQAITGVSYQTVARAFKDMKELGILTEENAATGGITRGRRVSPDMPFAEQIDVVREAFNDALEQGGTQAIQAGKALLDMIKEADVHDRYGTAREREARFAVRKRAAALGRALRERATEDKRLHELYYAAASTSATEDDRATLALYLDRHHEDLLYVDEEETDGEVQDHG